MHRVYEQHIKMHVHVTTPTNNFKVCTYTLSLVGTGCIKVKSIIGEFRTRQHMHIHVLVARGNSGSVRVTVNAYTQAHQKVIMDEMIQ